VRRFYIALALVGSIITQKTRQFTNFLGFALPGTAILSSGKVLADARKR